MAATPVRSRKVRKILRLEARARRLLTRYERALDKATRAKGQAHTLLDEATRLELALTGTQLGELRRARGETARETAQPSVRPGRALTDYHPRVKETQHGRAQTGQGAQDPAARGAGGHVAGRVRVAVGAHHAGQAQGPAVRTGSQGPEGDVVAL